MINQPLLAAFLIACGAILVGCQKAAPPVTPPSNVARDELVLFYPTYGSFDAESDQWRFDVHGLVFEPEESSTKRAALMAILRASIDADESEFMDERVRPFLADHERGKSITIRVNDLLMRGGKSGADGHFRSNLTLAADQPKVSGETGAVLELKAVLRDGDSRAFEGRVHLLPRRGVSLISDIDDTIKQSNVTEKSELLRNTFLREFRAVDGMPELYSSLEASGVAFHYVSGSPWQLYRPIDDFMTAASFPKGTVHLKQFRLKDSSAFDIIGSQQSMKLATITPIINAYPERSFLLVGDSGEQDPEIYGQIAREHPDQIAGIFIRNVTDEKADSVRFLTAFRDVPANRWALFDEASAISEQAMALAQESSAAPKSP